MNLSTKGNGLLARVLRVVKTYMSAQDRMSRGNYDTAHEAYLKSQNRDLYRNDEAMTLVVDTETAKPDALDELIEKIQNKDTDS